MTAEERSEILRLLDGERQTVIYPGVTRFMNKDIVRDVATDGKSAEVVYSSCSEGEVDCVIADQIQIARRERYDLEWKLYGHDQPHCLGERLVAAGFEADEQESFLVLASKEIRDHGVAANGGDIRRLTSREDLRDYQIVREEVSGESCEREIDCYASMLEHHPNNMSIYVAYVDGVPAVSGRIYFHEESRFGALFGGMTRKRFRKRGLFTRLVGARLREALVRGVRYICVDALPTSEPILQKLGFEIATYTRPYRLPSTGWTGRGNECDRGRS